MRLFYKKNIILSDMGKLHVAPITVLQSPNTFHRYRDASNILPLHQRDDEHLNPSGKRFSLSDNREM